MKKYEEHEPHKFGKIGPSEGSQVKYGISDRNDGNMCFVRAEGKGVEENRARYFKKAGINPDRVFVPDVIHSNEVIEIDTTDLGNGVYKTQNAAKVDGVISFIPNSTLALDSGDCPIILLFDPEKNMIGLVHAGWRSLEQGIIENMFAKISGRVMIKRVSILLGIGICKECYNFPMNINHPLFSNPTWNPYIHHHPNATKSIDLYEFILDRLKQGGIPKENISSFPEICSFHTKDKEGNPLYFSHRRALKKDEESAKNEGRFITFIHLPGKKTEKL